MSLDEELGLGGASELGSLDQQLGLTSERPDSSGVSELDKQLGLAPTPPPVLPPIEMVKGPAGAPPIAMSGQAGMPGAQAPTGTGAPIEPGAIPPPEVVADRLGALKATVQDFAAAVPAFALGAVAGATETLTARELKRSMEVGGEHLENGLIDLTRAALPGLGAAPKLPDTPPDMTFVQSPTGMGREAFSAERETAQSLKQTDYPRIVAYQKALAENGINPHDPSAWRGAMNAAVSLGDFTLFNTWAHNSGVMGDAAMVALGSNTDVQLPEQGGLLNPMLNVLARTPRDFAVPVAEEVAPNLVPVEAALLSVGKVSKAMLTSVEKGMPSLVRTVGGNKAYEIAVKVGQADVMKSSYKALQSLGTLPGQAVYSNEAIGKAAKALQSAYEAGATTLKPLGLKRAGDQIRLAAEKASATAGGTVAKVKDYAERTRIALNGDLIERIPERFQAPISKIQHAQNYGRNKAELEILKDFDREFGHFDLSDRFGQENLGWLRAQFLGPKSALIRDIAKEIAPKGAGPEAIASYEVMLKDRFRSAIQNKQAVNPRLEAIYTTTGRTIRHMETYMPDMVTKLNEYTHLRMQALDENLINPVAAKGSLTPELYRASKATPEQIAKARLEAWDQVWAEMQVPDPVTGVAPISNLREVMAKELPGDYADDALKVINKYMQTQRGKVELMKMQQGFSVKEGLYIHHMLNENAVNGRMGFNSLVREAKAGSKNRRLDQIGEFEFNDNLRDIMVKDLSEVHAAAMREEGRKALMEDGIKTLASLKRTTHWGMEAGQSYSLDVKGKAYIGDDGFVWFKPTEWTPRSSKGYKPATLAPFRPAEFKDFRKMGLEGMDKYTLHRMLATHPSLMESNLTEQLRTAIEGAAHKPALPGNAGALLGDSASSLEDTLDPQQMQKILAIMGEKKFVIHKDVQAFFQNMDDVRRTSHKEYLRQVATEGGEASAIADTGFTTSKKIAQTVNSVIRPIATGLDFGGLSQKLSYLGGVASNLGAPALAGVVKRTNRLFDERDLAMYERLLSTGAMYQNRALKTLGNEAVNGSWIERNIYQRLNMMQRHLEYGERSMYNASIASPGFDTKVRVATARWLEEKSLAAYDMAWSHPASKKMMGEKKAFVEGLLTQPAYKNIIRADRTIDDLAMGRELNKIFGSYDPGLRTNFEKSFMANFFPYYGWWRGTFLNAASAPLRHPVHAALVPLVAADSLNYMLSGQHMWDNPIGKKLSIKVDPARMGFNGPASYHGLPTNMALGFRMIPGEGIYHMVQNYAEGKHEQAIALAKHAALLDVPINLGEAVASRTMLGHLAALEQLATYSKGHEVDESTSSAVLASIGKLNYSSVELVRLMQNEGVHLSPELMYKVAVTLAGVGTGINTSFEKPPTSKEKQRQMGITGGMVPSAEAMRAGIQQYVNEQGKMPTTKSITRGLVNAAIQNAVEDNPDITPEQKKLAQNVVKRSNK